MPRDVKAAFRYWQNYSGSNEVANLNLMKNDDALSILRRSIFSLRDLQGGTVLGIDINQLDRHIYDVEFVQIMGINKTEFMRASHEDQMRARAHAKSVVRGAPL